MNQNFIFGMKTGISLIDKEAGITQEQWLEDPMA